MPTDSAARVHQIVPLLCVAHLHNSPMSLAARSPPLAPPPASLHSPSRLCCPSRSHALATRCRATADVLLVDAQNVLSRAGAGNGGHRLPGEGVAGSFADWLSFLAAVAEPQLVVAVFDAPRSQRGAQEREQLAPQYLQRRKRRQGQAAASAGTQAGEAAASAVATAQRPGGDPLRPFKQRVQQLGGVCLQAAPGWEADDGIAAACAAVQERRPLARLLVASGDQDMQQLLAQQVWGAGGMRKNHRLLARHAVLLRSASQLPWPARACLRMHNANYLALPLLRTGGLAEAAQPDQPGLPAGPGAGHGGRL